MFSIKAIGEELAFFESEDVSFPSVTQDKVSGGTVASVKSQSSGDVNAMLAPNKSSNGSRTPDSPGGSLGSASAVSKGSEAARSVRSSKSLK